MKDTEQMAKADSEDDLKLPATPLKKRLEIVDSHFHLWDLIGRPDLYTDFPSQDMGPNVYRTFTPDDYERELVAAGVKYGLHMQVTKTYGDNVMASNHGDLYYLLAGYVGWADLEDPHFGDSLTRLKGDPFFRGVRHPLAAAEGETADWLLEKQYFFILRFLDISALSNDLGVKVQENLSRLAQNNLPFDLCAPWQYLRHVMHVAYQIPTLKIVVNHCGSPDSSQGPTSGQWCDDMALLARYPNIVCKLSGLAEAIDSTDPATLAPYFHHCLREFGAERCLFGSNWPVCRLTNQPDGNPTSINTIVRLLEDSLESFGLSADDRRLVMGENAVRVYNLQLRPY